MTEQIAYAIVRPGGRIQKTRTVLEGVQLEIYDDPKDAQFIRDKAYPGFKVRRVSLSFLDDEVL